MVRLSWKLDSIWIRRFKQKALIPDCAAWKSTVAVPYIHMGKEKTRWTGMLILLSWVCLWCLPMSLLDMYWHGGSFPRNCHKLQLITNFFLILSINSPCRHFPTTWQLTMPSLLCYTSNFLPDLFRLREQRPSNQRINNISGCSVIKALLALILWRSKVQLLPEAGTVTKPSVSCPIINIFSRFYWNRFIILQVVFTKTGKCRLLAHNLPGRGGGYVR